jgi:hypothetical protein
MDLMGTLVHRTNISSIWVNFSEDLEDLLTISAEISPFLTTELSDGIGAPSTGATVRAIRANRN